MDDENPRQNNMTHLVEVLEQVDYPALGLVLGETGRGRVETSTLEDGRSELRNSDGRAADLEGSRGLDGTGGGGSERADNGGAEHGGKIRKSAKANVLK
jgi:hypothetical protein